jgi:replication factor C subunit 1
MYTTKYRPNKVENFIGNKNIIQPFIEWLLEWDNSNKKCALISGTYGIGKRLIVELILKKHDYNIIELTLDDERNKDFINNMIKPIIKNRTTIDGQMNALVVSELDAVNDYGFITSLIECIKESKIPIICICANRYEQSIKSILNYCLDFKMSKPCYKEVYTLLYNVVMKEKIKIKESELKELYDETNGDIRFILNTLQFGLRNSKKNIQSSNIFETTGNLLSIDETLDSKYKTFWLSYDLHPLMVQENYINNTFGVQDQIKKMENLSYSADALSDMDLFERKVNMTNWELSPYVAVNTIKATMKCNKKTMIKFPQILGRISTTNKNKREKINYDNVKFFEEEVKPKKEEKKVKEQVVKEKKQKVKEEVKEQVIKEKKPRGRPKKDK